jgi:uncharacterized metal-binding protein
MGCTDICREVTRILYTCSGCCPEGELADKIGRQLRREDYARCGGSCLAGISAGYPKFLNAAKQASEIVTIDGCTMACAKRTLEKIGYTPTSYILTSEGLTEGCNQQEYIASTCRKIQATDKKIR